MKNWSIVGPRFSAWDQFFYFYFRDSPNSTIKIWRDISIPINVDAISISARGFSDTKNT